MSYAIRYTAVGGVTSNGDESPECVCGAHGPSTTGAEAHVMAKKTTNNGKKGAAQKAAARTEKKVEYAPIMTVAREGGTVTATSTIEAVAVDVETILNAMVGVDKAYASAAVLHKQYRDSLTAEYDYSKADWVSEATWKQALKDIEAAPDDQREAVRQKMMGALATKTRRTVEMPEALKTAIEALNGARADLAEAVSGFATIRSLGKVKASGGGGGRVRDGSSKITPGQWAHIPEDVRKTWNLTYDGEKYVTWTRPTGMAGKASGTVCSRGALENIIRPKAAKA